MYLKKFCENPIENIDELYNPIEVKENKSFVFKGGKPSYHKYESCERLHSNFINYRIPEAIIDTGDDAIEEYRKWFKQNQELFLEKPDIYQMRLQTKFGIVANIQKVDYINSGTVYKENLSVNEIETRIDSLLRNAAIYYNANEKRQLLIRRFQTATFLAFKEDLIEDNNTGYSDKELKLILKQYYYMFIQPTLYYLQEYFKAFFNNNIELNEKIFEQLNFKKCFNCYDTNYSNQLTYIDDRNKKLKQRFGDFEFPIEPTKFLFKKNEGTDILSAFIYGKLIGVLTRKVQTDNFGDYLIFKIEFINDKNFFCYSKTKIYVNDIPNIKPYRKYLTRIDQNSKTKENVLTTFAIEL